MSYIKERKLRENVIGNIPGVVSEGWRSRKINAGKQDKGDKCKRK